MYRTVYYPFGKIAKVNDQWVTTRFFALFYFPLIPVNSIFVIRFKNGDLKSFEMDINKKSVIAAYCRHVTAVIAAIILYNFYKVLVHDYYNYLQDRIMFGSMGLLFAGLWVYFYFYFGKADKEEIILRNKVGKVTGIYSRPEWFTYDMLSGTLEELLKKYKNQYPDSDWKIDLQAGTSESDKKKLLYGIALFNCMVYDLPENDQLYVIADQLYQLNPENILT